MKLPIFYPIVPDESWIANLVPLGIKIIQLRIKNEKKNSIKSQIKNSLAICSKFNCTLVINDYWSEAINLGGKFVHLGQEDLLNADLTKIKHSKLKLGISTHSKNELNKAIKIKPDYIALGPIYETKLKKMKWGPQGLNKIKKWKLKINCPLVAIGGINLERASRVYSAGADSIAIVTDLINSKDPIKKTKQWLKLAKNLNYEKLS